MGFLAYVILCVLSIVGFAAIFFSNMGTSIMMIGITAFALMTHGDILSMKAFLWIFGFYIVGELLEYICIVVGVKKMGASNYAVLGAFLGAILGGVVGVSALGIGMIPGLFVGLFCGAFLVEWAIRKEWKIALKAGLGAALGRLGAIVGKVFIALIMIGSVIYHIVMAWHA